MHRRQGLPQGQRTYPAQNQKKGISSDELQFTPENPDLRKKKGYQKNIDDMKKYSAKKNPSGYPNTPYGIMQ
jgi:hypothetical protein